MIIEKMESEKPEIIWQSDSKNPLNNEPFMKIKKADGYYLYSERAGIDSVAFILIDNNKDKIGLIQEIKPPLYERGIKRLATAFGGSLDKNIEPEKIVIEEVKEEAGYKVDNRNITYIGKTMVSTQSNQMLKGYVVDVTNVDFVGADEDEKIIWLNVDELIENSDWKSIFIFTKWAYQLNK